MLSMRVMGYRSSELGFMGLSLIDAASDTKTRLFCSIDC